MKTRLLIPLFLALAYGQALATDGKITINSPANGAIVSGSAVYRSIISPGVKVNSYCEIQDSIIMNWASVGRHCKIKNAIVDKYIQIPEGEVIGYDLEKDRARFTVTGEGIVVIPKRFLF